MWNDPKQETSHPGGPDSWHIDETWTFLRPSALLIFLFRSTLGRSNTLVCANPLPGDLNQLLMESTLVSGLVGERGFEPPTHILMTWSLRKVQ
jgi:hypothetical protein